MKIQKAVLPAAVLSLLVLVIAVGCGRKKAGPDESSIVARIDNYEMTVKDFREEVLLTAANKYLPEDPIKAKEELLDELIVKKILVKEAQAQNFDKDKAFMKEIERYWEQALLKLLMRKKSREFARQIVVRDSDVRIEYERILAEEGAAAEPFEKIAPRIRKDIMRIRQAAAFESWISDLRKKTSVKINKKVLDEIKIR